MRGVPRSKESNVRDLRHLTAFVACTIFGVGPLHAQDRPPPCATPAPLTAKPVDADSPRVIVYLRDTSVANAEAAGRRLSAHYGVRFLMPMLAMPAFVAITTPPALERLRCDRAVRQVYYDELVRIDLLAPRRSSLARPNQRLQLAGAKRPRLRPARSAGGGQRTVEFGMRRHSACS